MNKLSRFFYQKSTLIVAIALTALSFSYLFLVLMDMGKCFAVETGSQSLGTSFGFSYEAVQQFFSLRTPEMVVCYRQFNAIWDNLFALLYGLMYVAWVSFLFKPHAAKVKWLNLLPALQTVCDWVENLTLVELADAFLAGEALSTVAVNLASSASMAKWVISSLVFGLILIGIAWRIVSALKKRGGSD